MSVGTFSKADEAALEALANGVIPADERDRGAAEVAAGARIAERVRSGVQAGIYKTGVIAASDLARERYGREVSELTAAEVDELLGDLRERSPDFFRQLRADTAALYLSDPGVWERIGFPGPSTEDGGYPDFAEEQKDRGRFSEPAADAP